MSTTHAVDFGNVTVRGAWADPSAEISAELSVYTKSGQARIASMSEAELIVLIEQAAQALYKLRSHAEKRARAGRDASPRRLDDSPRAMLDVEGPGGAQVLPR
jgi:hypothetical protein